MDEEIDLVSEWPFFHKKEWTVSVDLTYKGCPVALPRQTSNS